MDLIGYVLSALGIFMMLLAAIIAYLAHKDGKPMRNEKFEAYVGNLQDFADRLRHMTSPVPMDHGTLSLRDKTGQYFQVEIKVGELELDSREAKHIGHTLAVPEGSMNEAERFTFSPEAAFKLRAQGIGLDEAVINMLRASGRID